MTTVRSPLFVVCLMLLTFTTALGGVPLPAGGDWGALAPRPAPPRRGGATTAGVPPGAEDLRYDDGSYEYTNGVTVGEHGELGLEAVYLNRFTPPAEQLPITVEAVSILFPITDQFGGTGLRPRMTFEVLVYVDEEATGDPRHATLARRVRFDLEPSDTVFQTVTLPDPVEVTRGSVYVGFTDVVTSVTEEPIFPGAQDLDAPSGNSYAFHNFDPGEHFDGDDLSTSDSGPFLIEGAWLIRAVYSTGGTVQVCWDPGTGDGIPAPENARLCRRPADAAAGEARQGSLLGFKIYRSTEPNVQTTPENLFATTGPTTTTVGSGVAPGGTFFVVTGVYPDGESGPSNEVAAVPPTVSTLKVKPAKIVAKGLDFSSPIQVLVDGIPFVSAATVKQGKKVTQKGALLTGESIGAYLSAHGNRARVTFRNDDGTATTVTHAR